MQDNQFIILFLNYYSFPMTSISQMTNIIYIPDTKFAFNQEKKLGEGYGGEIYQGINVANSQQIAVKILNKNSKVENQISCSEIKQIAKINICKEKHVQQAQNQLVEVFDIIQLDKTFIIMQLCKCNLKQYLLMQGKFKEIQVLKILKQIVQALIKIEKHGYHFSDLKPQNILITKDNSVKLGDLQSLIKLNDLGKNTKQKFRHQIFGTLHYMPPELIQFGEYGKQNYIWTLGIILHEIIYRRPPFKITNINQNPSQERKLSHSAEFYKNLFNLNACNDDQKDYPKSHYLLKNMLRLNERKRISLQKLYEFLLKSTTKISYDGKNRQFFGQNSGLTEDNSMIEEVTSDEYFNADPLKNQYIDQNQKQSQNIFFLCQSIKASKIQTQQSQEQNNSTQLITCQFFNETFMLIDQIRSPLILVKKLDELKLSLRNILGFKNIQYGKNPKVQYVKKIQKCLKMIKQSKAFSHLQKTFKYSTSEKDKQLNMKELILWEHFDQLFNHSKKNSSKEIV